MSDSASCLLERPADLSGKPHLSLTLKHRLGGLELDAVFDLTRPWTVLFGPSGSGKSTILRAVAGLFQPHEASIRLRRGQETQLAADTAMRVFIPAHRRLVRWAGQTPALFPNMTVRQNLRFALGDPSIDRDRTVELALESFNLRLLGNASPATLSGGERQRASLARAAIAADGRLLLLDEPFSGLDTPLRDSLLSGLREWLEQHRTPVLSVTHDVGEAFLLGAEVIRLHRGRVQQRGPAGEVLAEERLRLLHQLNAAPADTS